ncbi:MAG: hypothetical protein ACLQGP_21170 [Isosphaeraceae bacterium]
MGWFLVADPDGAQHQLCVQDLDESCACASVAMLVRKIKNTMCEESTARQKIDSLSAFAHSTGMGDWSTLGTSPSVIGSALAELGVKDAKTWNKGINLVTTLQNKCTKSRPGIAAVYWTVGGGHAIVVLGKNAANTAVLFLDPGHNGVVSIPIGNLPTYTAPYGLVGTIDDTLVLTSW